MPGKQQKPSDSRVKKAEAGKLVYIIDCSIPVADDLVKPIELQVYLQEHLKIDNKPGNLGDKVKISLEGNNVVVTSFKVLFAKRYLKFLTRKWLLKEKLRDYLRPVSTKKMEYQLRYYNIHLDEEADE
eukprot:TRINITY_DN23924_c0_g1_i2.p2 TRINITY_DN23924_c0_g1~~TRINITY_DN23924_c0_g1_i2.p2  ORF type:complete len:128 (+),score=50.42 TRINITY_DN23924_c0_g1_i2:1148-1531(+)